MLTILCRNRQINIRKSLFAVYANRNNLPSNTSLTSNAAFNRLYSTLRHSPDAKLRAKALKDIGITD